MNIQRNVVIDQEDRLCAMLPGIANVGEHPIERIGVKVAPTHLNDGTEAAIKGAAARGLDDIYLAAKHGVAMENPSVAVWQADLIAIQTMHRARRILAPCVSTAIRQTCNVAAFLANFHCAH